MGLAHHVAQRVEQHAGVGAVIFGEQAFGHRREDHGDVVLMSQRLDVGGDAGPHRPEADGEHRLIGFGEEIGGFLQPLGGGLGRAGRGLEGDAFRAGDCRRQPHGQADMDRAGTALERRARRVEQGLAHAFGGEPRRLFGQRLEQRLMVDGHLHRAAAQSCRHFVGQRDHRRTIEQRLADAGRQVGGAGAEGAEADAGHAGHAAADVGHHAGAAFVGRQDELDALGGAQRLHVIDPAAARHAEDMLHAKLLQRADDSRRDGFFASGFLKGGLFDFGHGRSEILCGARIGETVRRVPPTQTSFSMTTHDVPAGARNTRAAEPLGADSRNNFNN